MGRLIEQHRERVESILARYPRRRSGMMPLLWLAQELDGWVTPAAKAEVAELTGATLAEVQEVVTFYTQFHQQPVGRFVLGVCGTLPCALCGAEDLLGYLREKLGVRPGEVTPDGLFTVEPMECLGACSEAPVMLVNQTIHGRLTRARIDEILDECRRQAGQP